MQIYRSANRISASSGIVQKKEKENSKGSVINQAKHTRYVPLLGRNIWEGLEGNLFLGSNRLFKESCKILV